LWEPGLWRSHEVADRVDAHEPHLGQLSSGKSSARRWAMLEPCATVMPMQILRDLVIADFEAIIF
jgi:hypothetical protein